MGSNGAKGSDFYQVLGLNKKCTDAELKNAYKKLALKWHPDRCSASGDPKYVEEAKKKFQSIQQAYSVLSDEKKRFLYDLGVYDSDEDEDGMADFMSEMAILMTQNKPNGSSGGESFEELQDMFEELFGGDMAGNSTSYSSSNIFSSSTSTSTSTSYKSDARFQGFSSGMDWAMGDVPS